jgi:hypothetical protein
MMPGVLREGHQCNNLFGTAFWGWGSTHLPLAWVIWGKGWGGLDMEMECFIEHAPARSGLHVCCRP